MGRTLLTSAKFIRFEGAHPCEVFISRVERPLEKDAEGSRSLTHTLGQIPSQTLTLKGAFNCPTEGITPVLTVHPCHHRGPNCNPPDATDSTGVHLAGVEGSDLRHLKGTASRSEKA